MNTTTRPNFPLLRDAFAIIDGIPQKSFDLDSWRTKNRGMSCGTIACAGGWLAMHPVMNQAGLSASEGGSPRTDKTDWGFGALREVFNLQPGEEELFEAHGTGYKDEELTEKQITAMSGKRLWKRRVLRLFQEYNEPFDPTAGRGLMLRARNA